MERFRTARSLKVGLTENTGLDNGGQVCEMLVDLCVQHWNQWSSPRGRGACFAVIDGKFAQVLVTIYSICDSAYNKWSTALK